MSSGHRASRLDGLTRAHFEPRFGFDFSAVRVHRDVQAAESARAVHARAYTVGNHIVFGDRRAIEHTGTGQATLAMNWRTSFSRIGEAVNVPRSVAARWNGPPSPQPQHSRRAEAQSG